MTLSIHLFSNHLTRPRCPFKDMLPQRVDLIFLFFIFLKLYFPIPSHYSTHSAVFQVSLDGLTVPSEPEHDRAPPLLTA